MDRTRGACEWQAVNLSSVCQFGGEGRRDRGRFCTRLLDGIQNAWIAGSLVLKHAKVKFTDKTLLMEFVNKTNDDKNV